MGNLQILLRQHVGAPCAAVVKAGDRVEKGTLIATPTGLGANIFSSAYGVVEEVKEDRIIIRPDEVQKDEFVPIQEGSKLDMVKSAGVVGMGGAGFPTGVKLGTDLKGGYILVNAAECEPLMMVDHHILEHHLQSLVDTLNILIDTMGADEAILLSDRAFGGSDTWATSYIIATAIKKINDFDIIFCGRQAIDGDTAQVGPQIAEQLNIPQITYVEELTVSGDKVTARRKLEEGYSVVEAKMPVLITAIKELNTPRYMTPAGIFDAYKKEVKVWGFDDVPVDPEKIGLKGSPTNVRNTFSPDAKGHGMMVKNLFDRLDEKHLL